MKRHSFSWARIGDYSFQRNSVSQHSHSSQWPFTPLLTPWCRVLLEKLTGLQLVKKFLAFHRTWRFITALTSIRKSRMWVFLNINILQGGVVSISPNPQAGGPPLVGRPRLLIQFIRSYPPSEAAPLSATWDVPYRGDSDHYRVQIFNLYTHVQVNLKIHTEGSKKSVFFKGIQHTANLLIVLSQV